MLLMLRTFTCSYDYFMLLYYILYVLNIALFPFNFWNFSTPNTITYFIIISSQFYFMQI